MVLGGWENIFNIVNKAWTCANVERMLWDIFRIAKPVNEYRTPTSEWTLVVPSVKWTLNMANSQRSGISPFHVVIFGWAT